MTTVHLIFNAHLDPVWLWPWSAGLDEALATCRSACDRLEAHPDLIFTRGEAWVYQQVERLDPTLFQRITAFVQAGRWEIVGGWWIQPDCNLPTGFGLEKQIALGRDYFQDRFGQFPKTAYNVDTFGHAASLPGMMRRFGQTQYVMMRPQEHEMALPARLFRWRGYEDGPEVTVFRIAGGYSTREIGPDHVQQSLTHLPDGVQDTMCFVGVGDHGGGPTEAQIAWVHQNQDAFPGCRLVMSSVSRFFERVAAHTPALPLVTGELQQHAIGCYSVQRAVKTGVRRAEHLLHQAGLSPAAGDDPLLTKGWEYACFHQFHDTLGGTCLPSAYPEVENQLGFAQAVASEALIYALRRRMGALPDCENQRLVFWNASDAPFDGLVETEVWLDWRTWNDEWRLQEEDGQPVPYQRTASEALMENMTRLALRLRAAPGELRVLQIVTAPDPSASASDSAPPAAFPPCPVLRSARPSGESADALSLHLELLDDPSDTWSHGLDRYAETGEIVSWTPPELIDNGPLLRSWIQNGTIGRSRLRAEWRLSSDQPSAELRLRVNWREERKLLKLVLPLPLSDTRTDGIPGGRLRRPNDGRELPLQDWTALALQGGQFLGIVCPDVFAADATADRARFTLLRSAVLAHHEPHTGQSPRAVISDQGVHDFRFEFWLQGIPSPDGLARRGLQMQRPPFYADLTRGMTPDD